MATTQSRVQFNLSAKDQTAAAFASVRRGLDSLNRSANQLKGLFAGALGGATIAKGIRELIAISAETEPVKSAFDRLSAAMRGFAQEIGGNGVNSALVYFSDRIGALIYGTDGLSKSIGALLGGGIRLLAGVFEGVGRAIAFAYDNLGLLGQYLTLFGIAVFAQKVVAAGAAFIYFAKSIRATGIIMASLNAVSRIGLLTFLALAMGVAYATDSVDKLKAGIETLWTKAQEIMPQLGAAAATALEGLGFDLSSISDDLANTSRYIEIMDQRSKAASTGVEKLAKTTSDATSKISSLTPTVKSAGDTMKNTMEGIGESLSQSLGDTIEGVVGGTMKLKEAWRSMAASIVKDLQNIASAMIRSGITSLITSALGGGGGGGLGSMNFGGPRASGGPVMAGRSYVVGEHRPELFTPTSNGYITPKVGGGGGLNFQPVYNIDARGSSAESVQQLQAQLNARDAQLRRELPGLIRMARQGGKI
jgi:hypothetical protein